MKIRFTQLIGILAFLAISNFAWSQAQTPLDIALRHIENNHKIWNLTQSDIADMAISSMYQSKKSGLTHIYFQQRHNGIAMKNAILNVNVSKEGKIIYVGKRFQADLQSQVAANSPSYTADQALQVVFDDLGISASLPDVQEGGTKYKFEYNKGSVASFGIPTELNYLKTGTGIQLAWTITIDPKGNTDMWEYNIDANTGALINKKDLLIRCSFADNPYHNHDAHCRAENLAQKNIPGVREVLSQENNAAMAGSYRVFGLPTESPIHGAHELVTDPNDLAGSPFGWHDTNGDNNPEYTITRGNNVYAFPDRDNDGEPGGDEPDGGMTLTFDYPYIADGEAIDNTDAATVNLFYMSNMVHDFAYAYGFDEPAGNFQFNTYGNGGIAGDHIRARAQAGADTGSQNNASFS